MKKQLFIILLLNLFLITGFSLFPINKYLIFADSSSGKSDNGHSDSGHKSKKDNSDKTNNGNFETGEKGNSQCTDCPHYFTDGNAKIKTSHQQKKHPDADRIEMGHAHTASKIGPTINIDKDGKPDSGKSANNYDGQISGARQAMDINEAKHANTISEIGSTNNNVKTNSFSKKTSGQESVGEKTSNQITVNDATLINNRERLMDKVSSVQDLNIILDKYQNLIDIPSSDINTSAGSGIDKTIAASNLGSTNIYYSINPQFTLNPQQIIKENYSVLMLKFADTNNNNIHSNAVNYDITIKDSINNNNIILKRLGFTNNGEDLQVIDENTFPKGEIGNPVYYQMLINISNINGDVVNEKTSIPIFIKVV